MKKFIMVMTLIILGAMICEGYYYISDYYLDIHPEKEIKTFTKIKGKDIQIEKDGKWKSYEIRGVNLGTGKPGKWGSENAIDKETYLRWFRQIQDMGANTIRIYTILHQDFYDAFYEYNKDNENPLYLIHGVWVDDYAMNSHRDAFDHKIQKQLIKDCRTVVDILHGNESTKLNKSQGMTSYNKDISQWVIGYIVGVEWYDYTVVYTDLINPERNQYKGTYMYTDSDATPFEAMLCETGDKMIEYETRKYKQQRLVAFSNWPTTDPFDYPTSITSRFAKSAKVDVEHIKTTDQFKAGTFASYHVYPYFPDYYAYMDEELEHHDVEDNKNTYLSYLTKLNEYHTIPVIISEYGVTTGRGIAQKDIFTGRNQGNMSEQQQGEAVIKCYKDIKKSGCSGGIVFSWQDEWFKRTWNTMFAVDLLKTPFWSDYQTNEQYYGLLSFDPGKEKSICYVDGDVSEWSDKQEVCRTDNMSLSMMYDEKFIYFKVYKKDYNRDKDILYIPIDVTPKSGSNYCKNLDLKFEKDSDFLIVLNGEKNSEIMVQERYEALRAMFSHEISKEDAYVDPVKKNSPEFKTIRLILRTNILQKDDESGTTEYAETFPTGKLKYGNANPQSENFNSLSDFSINGDNIEIKIPWQMLNFSNPSEMMIHDDYYEHYGVENLKINKMYVGIGCNSTKEKRIPMKKFQLKEWKDKITYHERLKKSYYIIKDYWTQIDKGMMYEN